MNPPAANSSTKRRCCGDNGLSADTTRRAAVDKARFERAGVFCLDWGALDFLVGIGQMGGLPTVIKSEKFKLEDWMSDEAGKTRRNLVVLSSAVVAIAFLEVPLQGSLIGAINLDKVDPKSAWIAVAVCLTYFLLRFLTDGNNTRNIKQWWAGVLEYQPNSVHGFLRSKQANASWEHWHCEQDKPDNIADVQLDVFYEPLGQAWDYERGSRTATARAQWAEYLEQNGRRERMRQITSLFQVSQRIPLKIYIKSYAIALCKATIPGWVFTEYVFPTVWAIASISICLYKMATVSDALFRLQPLCA
ncbi:hypothetical protein D3C86_1424110 [compost metagenome]